MKFRQPAAAALIFALLAAVARGDAILRGEILDFGVIVGRYVEDAPTEGQSGLEPAETIEDIRHLERTDRIEARLCRRFGITVRLIAPSPSQVPISVEGRVLHPNMTRPDGKQGTEARGPIAVANGVAYVGYVFNEEWEMVAGRWTLILSSGDDEIVRKDFTVTSPSPGTPNSDCGAV